MLSVVAFSALEASPAAFFSGRYNQSLYLPAVVVFAPLLPNTHTLFIDSFQLRPRRCWQPPSALTRHCAAQTCLFLQPTPTLFPDLLILHASLIAEIENRTATDREEGDVEGCRRRRRRRYR
jgi:hypothetical protein